MRLYQKSPQAPVFQSAEGAFKVELFNRNENEENLTASDHTVRETESVYSTIDELQNAVYSRAKEQGRITRKEVEEEFGFGSTKAYKVLMILCEAGLLSQEKRGKQTVYRPVQVSE